MMYNTNLAELPTNKEELERCLADPQWRIFSGCLYKIKIKGDDFKDELGNVIEADTFELPFKPNAAQIKFLNRLWHRNIILKARQLGFTTLICILWLDHALFNANQNCAIIAQDLPTVFSIFKDKIKFAYDNLPDEIRARFPLKAYNKSEIEFGHNGSSIRVATSFRSGTIHRMLISEFGKICASDPAKEAIARLAKELGGSVADIKANPNAQQSVNDCDTACSDTLKEASQRAFSSSIADSYALVSGFRPATGELGGLLPEFPWESIPTQQVLKYVGPVSFEYVWAVTSDQLDYWKCTISLHAAPEPVPEITQSGITEEVAFAAAIRVLKEMVYKNEWVLG